MSAISVGARLDRLPVTRLHRKVFNLVGVGMFFEGFDIYIAASVLGATYKTGFSTLAQNGLFISMTFVGMTLGALLTGFLGDRYGRRFTYQLNLIVFGAAALASAVAPDMTTLIVLRFLMGLGLGAEVVVGYSIMAEFFPARIRGRWSGHDVHGRHSRAAGFRVSRLAVGTDFWMARHVPAGRARLHRRMVSEARITGIATLAGGHGTRRGSRRSRLELRARGGFRFHQQPACVSRNHRAPTLRATCSGVLSWRI
jgi:hypothetical protein